MKTIQVDFEIDISDSTTVSDPLSAPDGYELVGLFIPAMTGTALTLTAAKTLTGTYSPVKNAANTAISITVDGTAHLAVLDPLLYRGLQFFKVVSGTVELADRVFTAVFQKRAT